MSRFIFGPHLDRFFRSALAKADTVRYFRGMVADPVSPPAPYERGEKTRAELAAELGVSERHYRRLLARERLGELPADVPDRDPEELPYVPLVDDPSRPGYLLDSSSPKIDPDSERICTVDSGKVRIGGGGKLDSGGGGPSQRCPMVRLEGRLLIRNVNGGNPVKVEEKKSEKPKKFKPHARTRKAKPLTSEEVERIKARASRRKKRPAPAA